MEVVHQGLRSRVCVLYVMGVHESTRHSNPAAFVCLTYKLQNDPSEKLQHQQTMHRPAPPPVPMGSMCVLCVAVYSLCVMCLFVYEPTGSYFPALEVNKKRRGVCFSG